MNPLRRLLQSTALLGLMALGAIAPAQTQGYVQKTRNIRAAVLLLDADKPGVLNPFTNQLPQYGQTAAPYAFYNLDQSASVKPDGWTFTNPYAPGVVTQDIVNRYSEIMPAGPNFPTIGSTISKNVGAYWTVRLSDLSETQIENYDVLLIAVRNNLSLNPLERERLRRFVDGGGVLWVDVLNGSSAGSDNLPVALQRVIPTNGTTVSGYYDVASSLISGPLQVTNGDLNFLNGLSNGSLSPLTTGLANDVGITADFNRYHQVSFDFGGFPTIAETRIGDGALVVTARGAAELLNEGVAPAVSGGYPNENIGYLSLTTVLHVPASKALGAAGRAAARLAVNIVSLGSDYRQPSGGARKSSSASADPGSPVLSRFTAEGSYGPPSNPVTGAPQPYNGTVTYKGYMVATVGSRIVVFDAVPGRDLDGDGDPDDGIVDSSGTIQNTFRDASVGKPYDVVWVSDDLGSNLSAPVCAEVPEAPNSTLVNNVYTNYRDQILVTDQSGKLHVFPLELRYGGVSGRLIGGVHLNELTTTGGLTPPSSGGGLASYVNNIPIPPTVVDGFAYMADAVQGGLGAGPVGRIWAADLSTFQRMNTPGATHDDWYVGGSASNNPLPASTASPTIGYIPIGDSSGGVDRVLYVPGISGQNSQPGFASVWIGAKGESPFTWDITGGTLTITTRAGSGGQLPVYIPSGASTAMSELAPHLTILDANGNPVSTAGLITSGPMDAGNGVINYSTTAADKASFSNANGNYTIRIDYTIDWGSSPSSLSANMVRGQLLLPVRQSPIDTSQRILGPIALTTHGTLHLVEAQPGAKTGGSYFAIREDAGRGLFRTVSRFTLYNTFTETFGAGTGIGGTSVPPVLEDADAVQKLTPFSGTTLNGFNYAGGVALRNGIAFVPINAQRPLGGGSPIQVPVTMVAAFRAEPETAELKIGTNLGTNPRLMQTDFARSSIVTSALSSPTQTSLAGASLTYDADNGTIRVENLASVTHGAMQDCLSESQPVGVSSDTQALTFRQPDAFGDRWSPLLWFGLWNGGTTTGTPLVAGNELYLPVNTFLPAVLSGTFNPGNLAASQNGVIFSIDADAPTSGNYETTLPSRPWIIQQSQLLQPDPVNNPQNVTASPYYRMPQVRGITNFSDYVVRLKETEIGASTAIYGVAGGSGVVTAWGNAGIYGLSRADFLVCDEGRLLKVDSAGNAVSTTFADRFSGIGNGGGAANTRPLVRPVKAYPVGDGQSLVVDAGGNKIVTVDADGTALRTIDHILLDPAYKPDAYRINEPLTLNDPRDATTFTEYKYLPSGATPVVTGQQAVEYWIHTIIADSGNHRLVELVDRFAVDPTTGRIGAPISLTNQYNPETQVNETVAQVGVLVWQSPVLQQASSTGEVYNSISRILVGAGTTADPARYVYVTAVSRTRPTRSAAGLDNPNATPAPTGVGGGAVVVFDPTGGTRVFDQFASPDLSTIKFYDYKTGALDTGTRASQTSQANHPFVGIQAVSASTALLNGAAAARVMVTDADAVYDFLIPSAALAQTAGNGSLGTPIWMLNEEAYVSLRTSNGYLGNPLFFRPAYARRLDSGEVIVVNGYRGLMQDRATAYTGEVLVFDGSLNIANNTSTDNLGFSLQRSVRFELPPLMGIRGLVGPVFADRR